MKKGVSILLVVLAMIHIGGFTPFYVAALEEVKMEAALELGITTNLIKVVVSPEEAGNPSAFKLHKEGEFCYHGKMYDYKKTEEQNGTRIFYAVQDGKEGALIDCLKSLFGDEHHNNTKGPLSKLLKNFSKDYVTNQAALFRMQVTAVSGYILPSSDYLSTGFTERIAYPPDNAV